MNDGNAISNGRASTVADAGADAQPLDHREAGAVGERLEDVDEILLRLGTVRHVPHHTRPTTLRSTPECRGSGQPPTLR